VCEGLGAWRGLVDEAVGCVLCHENIDEPGGRKMHARFVPCRVDQQSQQTVRKVDPALRSRGVSGSLAHFARADL
jgi:hypothetical protein